MSRSSGIFAFALGRTYTDTIAPRGRRRPYTVRQLVAGRRGNHRVKRLRHRVSTYGNWTRAATAAGRRFAGSRGGRRRLTAKAPDCRRRERQRAASTRRISSSAGIIPVHAAASVLRSPVVLAGARAGLRRIGELSAGVCSAGAIRRPLRQGRSTARE